MSEVTNFGCAVSRILDVRQVTNIGLRGTVRVVRLVPTAAVSQTPLCPPLAVISAWTGVSIDLSQERNLLGYLA